MAHGEKLEFLRREKILEGEEQSLVIVFLGYKIAKRIRERHRKNNNI